MVLGFYLSVRSYRCFFPFSTTLNKRYFTGRFDSGILLGNFFSDKAVFVYSGIVTSGLGAVFAILATPAASAVDNGAEVYMISAEMFLKLSRAFFEFLQRRVYEEG